MNTVRQNTPNVNPGPIETAYQTVRYGQLGNSDDFRRAVFCGHPDPAGLAAAKTEFVWSGYIWNAAEKKDAPGAFLIVSPYPISARPESDAGRKYGKGLRDENVGTPCVLCLEIDEDEDGNPMPLGEQCRLIDGLVAAGLPSPTAVCLSGGKSVHAFWGVTGMDWPTRDRLEQALLALVPADPSVGNRGRKMRLGGYIGEGRVQTILHLSYQPSTAERMKAGIQAVRAAWGVTETAEAILQARMSRRAARKQGTASTGDSDILPFGLQRSKKSGGLKATWNPATTDVDLADGRTVKAGSLGDGKHTCYCPYHSDSTPSAVIWVSRGSTTLYCSTCATTWRPSVPRLFAPAVASGDWDLEIDQRYVSLTKGPLPAKALCLRSARGTGKTTGIVSVFRKELEAHPERRAIVIVHRRALVAKYLHDLDGLGFVGMPEKGPIVGDRIVVCLDSLPRVPVLDIQGDFQISEAKRLPWHLAFIDESEQVIGHLDADSLRKNTPPEVVVWTLQHILQAARTVILADADLSSLSVDFLKRIGVQRVMRVRNTFQIPRVARLYTGQPAVEDHLWAAWKAAKRVAVASTTRSDATRIAARLQEARPDAKVVLVTSDTSMNYVDLIAHPDGWIAEHQPDALVYSPSLGTGVDISIQNYWDTVYLVGQVGLWTDVYSILQAAERVRNPKEETRHIWIRDVQIGAETDIDALRKRYVETSAGELHAIKAWGYLPPGVWRITICETTREIILRVRSHRAQAQGHITKDAVHEMVEAGWRIEWSGDDSDEIERKKISAEKKAIKDQWIQMITQAPVIEVEDAEMILRRGATMDERASALATLMRHRLGVDEIDEELVRAWVFGHLGSKISRFGLASLLLEHPGHIEEALDYHLARLSRSSTVSPLLADVRQVLDLISGSVVTPKMEGITIVTTPKTGVTTDLRSRLTSVDNHATLIQDVRDALSLIGVKCLGVQTRVGNRSEGKRTREYRIDWSSVDRMERLTKKWLERRGVQMTDDTVACALMDD